MRFLGWETHCKFECWQQAMQVELSALETPDTWKIVDLP